MEFLKLFNILLNNQYNYLKVKSVYLSKKDEKLNVKIIFIISSKAYEELTVNDYIRIRRITQLILGEYAYAEIEFEQSNITEIKLIERIKHYIAHNEILVENPKKLNIEVEVKSQLEYIVTITLQKSIAKFFVINNTLDNIKKYLSYYFVENIDLFIKEVEDPEIDFDALTQKTFRYNFMSDTFPIIIRDYVAGKTLPLSEAFYISKFKDAKNPISKITMAGEVSSIKKLVTKKKGDLFYKFTLSDRKNSIDVIYFTKSSKKGPFEEVVEGDVLAVFGDIKFDDYSQGNVFYANTIAYCDIKNFDQFKDNLEKIHNTLHEKYINVIPEAYDDSGNFIASIYDINNSNQFKKQLENKTFVVFDLETTGLNINACKILELAGAKIQNGKIIETFQTLVYPEMNIPPDATKINNITDDMVANMPIIEDVIPDFYRFAKDAFLVGHNIKEYDLPILNRVAKEAGYIFENKFIDTLIEAKKVFHFENSKLTTIANGLNINTENAHRAIADVVMNAKIFLYMANNFKIDSLQ